MPIYVGGTRDKCAYFDSQALADLGGDVEAHGSMPDVVVYREAKGWLVLIEAMTGHGLITPERYEALKELFGAVNAGLVFVTAFPTRQDLAHSLLETTWRTAAWVAESPDHLIHFNADRLAGPFE